MGIYSTMELTRSQCIEEIKKRLEKSSDTELENALFALLRERMGHNFLILKEEDFKNSTWYYRYYEGCFDHLDMDEE